RSSCGASARILALANGFYFSGEMTYPRADCTDFIKIMGYGRSMPAKADGRCTKHRMACSAKRKRRFQAPLRWQSALHHGQSPASCVRISVRPKSPDRKILVMDARYPFQGLAGRRNIAESRQRGKEYSMSDATGSNRRSRGRGMRTIERACTLRSRICVECTRGKQQSVSHARPTAGRAGHHQNEWVATGGKQRACTGGTVRQAVG